jgi:hypothetical protein
MIGAHRRSNHTMWAENACWRKQETPAFRIVAIFGLLSASGASATPKIVLIGGNSISCDSWVKKQVIDSAWGVTRVPNPIGATRSKSERRGISRESAVIRT